VCASDREGPSRATARASPVSTITLSQNPTNRLATLRYRWTINDASFLAYDEQVLLPTLKPRPILIIDDLARQRKPDAAPIRAASAKLFLCPPYSPDLNSIEQVFSSKPSCARLPGEQSKPRGGG
jgi:hypothetical protein